MTALLRHYGIAYNVSAIKNQRVRELVLNKYIGWVNAGRWRTKWRHLKKIINVCLGNAKYSILICPSLSGPAPHFEQPYKPNYDASTPLRTSGCLPPKSRHFST